MRIRAIRALRHIVLTLAALTLQDAAWGQTASATPMFTEIVRRTNGEIALTLTAPANSTNSIDVSSNLQLWRRWITLQAPANGLSRQTDSAAPIMVERFFRVSPPEGPATITGDHFPTDDGDVVVHPVGHAGFAFQWKDVVIYNDPRGGPTGDARAYATTKADLILVGHEHGDHFDSPTLTTLRKTNTIIITPQTVFNSLSAALKAQAIVLTNGASTNVLGLRVEAVPAYNGNHPRGQGNGYVLTIGGVRFYMSGDTGNTAEMRALQNIDVAFLAMNVPFTMSIADAVAAVRGFRPKIVYPYHYSGTSQAELESFKRQAMTNPAGTEVRFRKWY